MNRLPSYDRTSGRVERMAFLGLSLVAVTLIAMVSYDASRFALLGEEGAKLVPASISVAVTSTNKGAQPVTTLRRGSPEESAGAGGSSAPKS